MPAHPFERAVDHTRPHGSHRYDVFASEAGRVLLPCSAGTRIGCVDSDRIRSGHHILL